MVVVCTVLAFPSSLAGVGPYAFFGCLVLAALMDQLEVRFGLGGGYKWGGLEFILVY